MDTNELLKQNDFPPDQFIRSIEEGLGSPALVKMHNLDNEMNEITDSFGGRDLAEPETQASLKSQIIDLTQQIDPEIVESFVDHPELFPAYFQKFNPELKPDDSSGLFVESLIYRYSTRQFSPEILQKLLGDMTVEKAGTGLTLTPEMYDVETYQNADKLGGLAYGPNSFPQMKRYYTTLYVPKAYLRNAKYLPAMIQEKEHFSDSLNTLRRVLRSPLITQEQRDQLSKMGNFYHRWTNGSTQPIEPTQIVSAYLPIINCPPEIIKLYQEENNVSDETIQLMRDQYKKYMY